MKKRVSMMLIVLVVFLTACTAKNEVIEQPADVAEVTTQEVAEEPQTETREAETETVEDELAEEITEDETVDAKEETATYPMTITDQNGREVVIEKQPQRLVSCYYITTSALIALGLQDQVVGVESQPERRPIYEMSAPEILSAAQVGSPKELDLEVCASIQPDLVILPMRAKEMAESLEQLNIPVIIVNPEGQELILEMLDLIGTVTGQTERAQQLTDYIRTKADYLQETLADCERPTVYLGGNSSFLSTATKGMYQNDLITMAGGKNVAGEIDDTYWVESSYEQILTWNPEVIVMASDAKYSMDEILGDDSLSACQVIQEKKVYQIPSDIEAWDSPVPSSILGAYYVASMLHPDKISSTDYENMVEEYYETFYGFSYNEKKTL